MLRFTDISCSVGKRDAPNPGSFHSVEDLKSKMRLCGIETAFVWHSMSLEDHPVNGNREIVQIAQANNSILPVWVLVPHYTGEMPEPPRLMDELRENNVRAVRFFPKYNSLSHSLEEWSCGALFNHLAESGIPIIMDIDETDWNTIYGVCKRHPDLSCIVTKVYYRHGRYFYALWEELDNLYIEISWYKTFQGIEDICEKYGAERLLFGTSAPFFDPGPAVSMVLYADISQEQKELIAHGNIERLTGV
ncbi:MAG TPA: amidohydrolase family protein [Spirochaetia bacterium]|nr:amidohydrolase family protein [Spirochaetia bacterium]